MISGKRVLALVPARSGSKGIPGKNIANCGGKPLIAWSIEAAKASRYIDYTLVSTDSDDISRVAVRHSAESLIRPADLAQDTTPMEAVMGHALECISGFDFCVLLQPTSPLRTTDDINGALELFDSSGAHTLASGYHLHALPFYSDESARRQDREPLLMKNGAIYIVDVKTFKFTGAISDADTVPYLMPPERSIDIDYPWQMSIAATIIGTMR